MRGRTVTTGTPGHSWRHIVCRVTPLLCLIPYLVLAFFAQPAYDDYCYAARLHGASFFELQRWHYLHWTGRYAATAFLGLSELTGAIEHTYWLYVIGTIALTVAAVRLLLSRLSRAIGRPTNGLFLTWLAVALVAFFISKVTNPAESFYWLPGAFTYQLGVVCTVATTALLLSLSHEPPSACSRLEVLLLALLGIVASGLCELFIPVMLVIYSIFAIAAFTRGSRSGWVIVGLASIVAISGLFAVLAPGNAARAAAEGVTGRESLVSALPVTLKWSLLVPLRWLPDVGLVGLSLAVTLLLGDPDEERTGFVGFIHHWHPLVKVVSLAGFVGTLVFISAFPVAYAMNAVPQQPRVLNTVFMLMILGWLAALLIGANEFPRWRPIDREATWTLSALLLALSILGSTNFLSSLRDLRTLPQFYWEMRARRLVLANVRADEHIILKPLHARHRYLLLHDISSTNVSDERNTCLAAYLGVASILLEPGGAREVPQN